MRTPCPSWALIERCLLLIIAVVPVSPSDKGSCPQNVHASTELCLVHYDALVDSLETSGQTFYSGVDVETIRQICQAFTSSAQCAHRIKMGCPAREHADIMAVVSGLESVAELCTQPNLIEVYARYQNCYTRSGASSNTCYHKYDADTMDLVSQAEMGDESALTSMCSHYNILVQCIQTSVRFNCDDEAARLVEYLIKPSINLSEHCNKESLQSTSQIPTTKEPSEDHKPRPTKWQQVSRGTTSAHVSSWCIVTLILTFLVL